MKKIVFMILVLAFAYTNAGVSIAQAPDRSLKDYTVPELVEHFASQYQVSAPKMLATMKCESGLNPKAVGDHGNSYGIAQIHLPSHPDITKSQATDPVFASEWTANQFAKGKQNIWTCYRALYTKGNNT